MNHPELELEIHLFPCLADNYGFLIHDREYGLTATIDTPEVTAIEKALVIKGWKLTYILNTHHHWDHAGGNLELKEKTGCVIVGPRAEATRIPGIDIQVGEGDTFAFGQHTARILATPGHTLGHIVYHFEHAHAAFVGDTLFALGCGRLFEGTAEQMWRSLQKLMQWPDETRIYCAHEYTQKNAHFALTIEPGNQELVARAAEIDRLRKKDHPTIPSLLAMEKMTNPFLRPTSREIRDRLDMLQASDTEVFARIRELKDRY